MLANRPLAGSGANAYYRDMRYLIAPLLMLLLAGCQTLDTRTDARKLELTLESYASAVRWASLSELYAFLQPELRPEQPPAGLENIRVTGYEVSAAPRELAEGRVAQTAVIQYVVVDRQILRTLVDHQLWVLTDGSWQRANPIPPFQ